ncbi:hypothetical protein YIM_14200 [Amycolatopsis sp. YIM 10]|nr:hypothetical protein YIM_14200 [Amycolatopsis sp. YIM 10]
MRVGHPELNIVNPLAAIVERRLADLTRSAATHDTQVAAWVARHEIPVLAEALRAVLAEHRTDARGRCVACRGRRWRQWRNRHPSVPCRAYVAARLALGDGLPAEITHPAQRRKHRRRRAAGE